MLESNLPNKMSSYSKTPLIKKLGIKPGSKTIFINEPASFYKSLGDIPNGTKQIKELNGKFDYVHYFTSDYADLKKFFAIVNKFLEKNGILWISWPKRTSGMVSDVNENIIREIGLKNGLVDVKVAAIDEVWSGLKFVFRLKDRD